MSNYPHNFSHFPRHASLPSFASRAYTSNYPCTQNMHSQLQGAAKYNTQQQAQPSFELTPDLLALPLQPTVPQLSNIQPSQTLMNDTHIAEDNTRSCFVPQQDTISQMESNGEQRLQDIQPQYPILSSDTVGSPSQTLFEPLPDIITSLNSSPQELAQGTWPMNIQQKVSVPSSAIRRNCNESVDAPLPDILTQLRTLGKQRLTPDIISQPIDSQAVNPTQLLFNQNFPQFTRRNVSKPTMPVQKISKTKPRSTKAVRESALSHAERTQFQFPSSGNSTRQFAERAKNMNSQAPFAGLSGVLQNNEFKASLQSVLARSRKPHSSSLPTRTQSILQPRFPDREESRCMAPKARFPPQEHLNPDTMEDARQDRSMPAVGVRSAPEIEPREILTLDYSKANLKRSSSHRSSNPPVLTIRKRPVSCSALPSKKGSREIAKDTRPCASVDQAVAEGRELSKKQLRVLKNRQHAFDSRARSKTKKMQYDQENALLKVRITQLEDENEKLRTMRNTLLETAPEHLRMQVQMIERKKENGSDGK